MKKRKPRSRKRPGGLTALDMFKGDLLTAEIGKGRHGLFYLTGYYMSQGGKFNHFKAACLLAEADDHEMLLEYSESLIDEGGIIWP
jgi:hypothetical protein